MAPPEGRESEPKKILCSIVVDPADDPARVLSSTITVLSAERTQDHDHAGSSRSDLLPAAERAGQAAVVGVDQVSGFIEQAPTVEGACGHAADIAVDQASPFLIEQPPAAERAGGHAADISCDQVSRCLVEKAPEVESTSQNCPTFTAGAARVPARENSVPSPDDQAPVGEENFGHPAIVTIEQVPAADQTTIPTIQQVSGRVRLPGPRDGPPGRRRNRWDQAPSRCLNCTGHARRIMTCCRVLLCTDCALVNPCGCREWAAGYGHPVPILPRYQIPEDCIIDDAVMLSHPRWQLFHTSRVGDQVLYWFYSVEDAYHHSTVRYQFHRYETQGRSWSRVHCLIVDFPGAWVHAYFAAPPISEADTRVMQRLMRIAQRCRSEY